MLNKKTDKNQLYLDVAKLHIETIKSGFLPSLGIKFLALMYRCIDESNSSILITKYKDYQLVGFVSGSLGTLSLYKIMLNHPLKLIISLLPIIIDFKKINKILDILKLSTGSDRAKYPKAELLTICVHSNYHRQGIGLELYKNLYKYFQIASINEFIIIVGKTLKANIFYKNLGASLAGEIKVHSNLNSNLYIQKVE